MAVVRTIMMQLDADVDAGVYVDDVAQEAVSGFFRNDSGLPAHLWFHWKTNQEYDLVSSDSGEVVQPIPPGQRKWVPVNGDIDMDFDKYLLEYT